MTEKLADHLSYPLRGMRRPEAIRHILERALDMSGAKKAAA